MRSGAAERERGVVADPAVGAGDDRGASRLARECPRRSSCSWSTLSAIGSLWVQNAFTGAALDRVGDSRRRDPDWLAAQLAHPGARAVVAGDRGLRIADGPARARPAGRARRRPSRCCSASTTPGPVFAVDEDPPRDGRVPMVGSGGVRGEPPKDASGDRIPLRQAAARFSRADGGLAAYTAALLNWHRRHRYCSACGHASDIVEGGLTRHVPELRHRASPAHRPGRDHARRRRRPAAARPPGRAGRPGATPRWRGSSSPASRSRRRSRARCSRSPACASVGVDYVASQPWPFPASLMLGFSATYESGEAAIGDEELQDVRWFDTRRDRGRRGGARIGQLGHPGRSRRRAGAPAAAGHRSRA